MLTPRQSPALLPIPRTQSGLKTGLVRQKGLMRGDRHGNDQKTQKSPQLKPGVDFFVCFCVVLWPFIPMPKPFAADSEAPKKLSTYTIKLDDAQLEKLRAVCDARGWEPCEVPYARFAFRGPDVNVTAYDKRKVVVIAGKGTEEFVLNTLETEVTQAPRLGYDEVLHPERFEPHAGLDESGKGDFFGPVIAATVIAYKPAIDAWLKAGVKDSKQLADSQILRLDDLIRKTRGAVAKTCFCGMPKYNELMLRPGANLNRLLAWQHATALDQALNEKWVPWGLLDQFSKQPLTQRELAKKAVKNFELKMRTRAEEDPVVAAASVVARAEYVRVMKKLSQRFGAPLQKGASGKVKEQAAQLMQKFGAPALGEFAKLHFRTAYEVVAAAGKLGELPLPVPKERVKWRRE
jgi:ribonuclease HIII